MGYEALRVYPHFWGHDERGAPRGWRACSSSRVEGRVPEDVAVGPFGGDQFALDRNFSAILHRLDANAVHVNRA
jgi:hypothetical protein